MCYTKLNIGCKKPLRVYHIVQEPCLNTSQLIDNLDRHPDCNLAKCSPCQILHTPSLSSVINSRKKLTGKRGSVKYFFIKRYIRHKLDTCYSLPTTPKENTNYTLSRYNSHTMSNNFYTTLDWCRDNVISSYFRKCPYCYICHTIPTCIVLHLYLPSFYIVRMSVT